jgi:hypothetical protein
MQSLEERLRSLDVFVGDFLQRRRARRPATQPAPLYHGAAEGGGAGRYYGGGGGGGGGGAMPAAKRQRLEDAHQIEIQRWGCRACVCVCVCVCACERRDGVLSVC